MRSASISKPEISTGHHQPIMNCLKCQDTGWVCEDHEYRPSDVVTEGGCDCGGAAVPCSCTPEGIVEWKEVFASIKLAA